VDFREKKIGLVRTKTGGEVHWIPMHASLLKHLELRSKKRDPKSDAGFVMPSFANSEERILSKIFRETILPRIGISQPYAERTNEKGVGRKLAAYSIHSLRHSLPTWLNAAGVSEMMRMRIVGHDDEEVSRNYTHTEIEAARTELAKLPAL
jgi:integrase